MYSWYSFLSLVGKREKSGSKLVESIVVAFLIEKYLLLEVG